MNPDFFKSYIFMFGYHLASEEINLGRFEAIFQFLDKKICFFR